MHDPPKLSPGDLRIAAQILAAGSAFQDALKNDPAVAAQRQELCQAIGEAITEWGAIEGRLAEIYTFCITGAPRLAQGTTPAIAAFHAVINFNSGLAMANQAALWRLSKEYRTRWRTLQNKILRQAKHRNAIAHFSIGYEYNLAGKHISVYLSPHSYTFNEERPKSKFKLSGTNIREHTEFFRALEKEIMAFSVQIGAIPATPVGQLQEFAERLAGRLQDRKDKG